MLESLMDLTIWYNISASLQLHISAVVPIYPIMHSPYTFLSSHPSSTIYFSVLDLKDMFFTVPLHPDTQNLFGFTWINTLTQISFQLTWTVLPQEFWGSPHFSGQTLSYDLISLTFVASFLLQHVNCLLCSSSIKVSQGDMVRF